SGSVSTSGRISTGAVSNSGTSTSQSRPPDGRAARFRGDRRRGACGHRVAKVVENRLARRERPAYTAAVLAAVVAALATASAVAAATVVARRPAPVLIPVRVRRGTRRR